MIWIWVHSQNLALKPNWISIGVPGLGVLPLLLI